MGQTTSDDHVYLSIVRWPVDVESPERVIAVRAALDVDEYQARRIVMCGAPTVARVMPPGAPVAEAIAMLAKIDAVALAPSRATLDALPNPLKAKALHPADGAPHPMYSVEPWVGETGPLVMDDVYLIVRGVIVRMTTHVGTTTIPDDNTWTRTRSTSHMAFSAAQAVAGPVDSMNSHQVIDLYRIDGTRVRIDADRFSFGVLGAQRGLTDLINTDKLALRLTQEAP